MPGGRRARLRAGLDMSGGDPASHLLSNGRYTVALGSTAAWNGLALTSAAGLVVYVRDLDRGVFWCIGDRPVRRPAHRYEVRYRPGVVTVERLDDEIESRLDGAVARDADAEIRSIVLV
ncbi:MAG: hypothetical protein E6J56_03470, partial [Deltaproteobacteria bacterium]